MPICSIELFNIYHTTGAVKTQVNGAYLQKNAKLDLGAELYNLRWAWNLLQPYLIQITTGLR